MIKEILRSIYYFFYDVFSIIRNLKSDRSFIIIIPRFLSFIFKTVFIFEKKNKSFFIQKIRNKYDMLTVYDVFSKESYNLKNFKIFDKINLNFNNIIANNKKPLILDCGSNIGCSSEYFSKVFSGSFVISIEPDVTNLEFSKKNINRSNNYLLNKAINCENKKVYLQVDKNDSRATKIADNGDKMISSVTVEEALKEFDKEKYQPFLIKIDIEGFEKELFSKNYDWIDYFEVIIIEIHDWMIFRKSNSYTFLSALVDVMNKKNKRDLLISGENLISIKI